MKYDVLFADIDGTLLRDDKSMPQNNLDTIKILKENNIEFVLASGRSYMSLKNISSEYMLDNNYGISFNGDTVYKSKPFEFIYSDKLSQDISLTILKFLKGVNAEVFFYANDMLWIENVTPWAIKYSRHSMLCPKRVYSLEKSCKFDLNKIIVFGDNKILSEIQEDFSHTNIHNAVNCCFSSENLLEFNTCNNDKGTALNHIMNLPQFKGKKSIAVGDSFNDIPMLKSADLSFAPSNSPQAIKDSADIVLKSSNNDGILTEILENYIM